MANGARRELPPVRPKVRVRDEMILAYAPALKHVQAVSSS